MPWVIPALTGLLEQKDPARAATKMWLGMERAWPTGSRCREDKGQAGLSDAAGQGHQGPGRLVLAESQACVQLDRGGG